MFHGINIAVECAQLLTGDSGYLDFLRSQIKLQIDNGKKREDGQLLVAVRYGPDGWDWSPAPGLHMHDGLEMRGYWLEPTPLRGQDIMHLYHASMAREDYQLITQVRDGDVERDWNDLGTLGEKNWGNTEFARFQYYDGRNPGWPEQILAAEYQQALETYEVMRADERSHLDIISTNRIPGQPVLTKGLTQVAMGAPQSVYNGGLLRATVRYFDADRARPGLPPDVAALVDALGPEMVGIQLVNTNHNETRRLIVQAGAFGEHQFTGLKYREEGQDGETAAAVDGKYFSVELPPSTSIRVEAGLKRFCNAPGYAFPWHGDSLPVPFPS
jgi:hypothetical protein